MFALPHTLTLWNPFIVIKEEQLIVLVPLVFCLLYFKLVSRDEWSNMFQSETVHFCWFMEF